MINILKEHLESYPDMEIQDAAKLLYQSEFGGGHMITNTEKSLERIQEEYTSLKSDILDALPLTESIGNGISRIYLSSLHHGLKAETLNEMFVRSAEHKKGSVEGLESKIYLFLKACHDQVLPFAEADAATFFDDWKLQGYPAVSHSEIYRNSHHPAYRVVEESFAKVCDIICRIQESKEKPFLVAIDGMSGSGKSTLGELLHKNFPESNLFHMDDYFLQPHQRTKERLAEIGGNVDYERFKEEIIDHLNEREGLDYQPYNCCTQSLETVVHVPWKPIVIIEGSYSQHPSFGNIYDLKIFCEISDEEQKQRIINRNGERMWKRFEEEWIPKEHAYFEKFQVKCNNIIIHN